MRRLNGYLSGVFILFMTTICEAQIPNPVLVGYWHNWNDVNAPYISLDAVDPRYNLIEVSFAVPTSPTDMTMLFTPDLVNPWIFTSQMQTVQSQGRKVLISIGGATTSIDLSTTANKNAFITSMVNIIDTYGFDGIDIDIEHGNAIEINGGTIVAPGNISQVNLIDAIKQIMANHWNVHGKKLLLTMAPETAYVQGGQSAFGGIWGGYLPIIHGLRDSLDLLHVQLYNSGSQYGIDGGIYTQGNADFIVAMTEAVIQGFNTGGGFFTGISADKVAIGLPACSSAAGGGFVDTANVKAAVNYLRGVGNQPGTYTLFNSTGYPDLRGMMTWSVNWDAVNNCGGVYEYAENFENIFGTATGEIEQSDWSKNTYLFPNPSTGTFIITNLRSNSDITITDSSGRRIICKHTAAENETIELSQSGIYFLSVKSLQGEFNKKLIVTGK